MEASYAFDIAMDVGAYRDLHRHRRCQQFRQAYGGGLGYDCTPFVVSEAGLGELYSGVMDRTFQDIAKLPGTAGHYLLPFAARSRFLFKMDFAEAEYIARLRSGVKGHFSYRQVAWEMKRKMEVLEPELGTRLVETTPPWSGGSPQTVGPALLRGVPWTRLSLVMRITNIHEAKTLIFKARRPCRGG